MTETDPLCLSLWPVCSAVEVQDEGMSGVQLFFTILFSILGLGVLAVIGLMVYSRWKENKRKRFYWSQNSPSSGVLHSVFVSQCQTPLKNWNTQPEDVKENWMGLKLRAKKTKDVTAVTYIFFVVVVEDPSVLVKFLCSNLFISTWSTTQTLCSICTDENAVDSLWNCLVITLQSTTDAVFSLLAVLTCCPIFLPLGAASVQLRADS